MNNSSDMNILFYSQKCEYCRNLLLLLKNENLLGYFKLICVDDKLDKLPLNMKVPTMKVLNVNKLLVAQEAFEWVNQMKFIRQQQVMDINKKIIQQNLINTNVRKGPLGFDNEIMGGISDKFALTKSDDPLPQAYFGIGQEDKNIIFTAPQEQAKISKIDQSKMMKELESRRTQQDTEHVVLTKQKQLEAVLDAEHEKLLNKSNNNLRQQPIQQPMQQIIRTNIKR